MRVEWSYIAVFAIVVAALAFFAWAVARSGGASVDVTIGALSTGNVEFDLGGVHFRETNYSPSPFPDGTNWVTFLVTFPDGAQEQMTTWFGGYCSAGSTGSTTSVHHNPVVYFAWRCGDDHLRVSVV